MRILTTLLILSSTTVFAQDMGNTGLGDVGAFNNQQDSSYQVGDSIGGDQTNQTVHNNNSTTTTNSTQVQNGAKTANGYVTTVPVIASNGTCMGSTGGSLSAAGIGVSSNKTYEDDDCNRRMNEAHSQNLKMQQKQMLMKQAELLHSMGLKTTAISLLCQDYATRQSLRLTLDKPMYDKLCRPFHN